MATPSALEKTATERVEAPLPVEVKEQLDKKVSEARPPSTDAVARTVPRTESDRFKMAIGDRTFPQSVEAEHVLKQSLTPGGSRLEGRLNGTAIESYQPSKTSRQAILARVENQWGNRDLDRVNPEDWTNREREGLGVEGTIQRMKESGEYTDFVRLGERNKPDVLCLAKDGRLCAVECKGHTTDVQDTGYINDQGEKAGTLASKNQDGVFFENEPQWLEKNRPHIENALRQKIEDPRLNSAEKTSCRRLSSALERTDLRDQSTYHRVVGTVGPEAKFGNVGDYVTKVKPEKMIQTRMSV